MSFFIGVDVGTGSARAGIFDGAGRRLGIGSHPIAMRNPQPDYYEQSSEDIWAACARAVHAALAEAQIEPGQVSGIAFDATCSLVVLDNDRRPVAVNLDGDDEWNIIVWMDHRAVGQAEDINAAGHPLLAHVGGSVSPEMQTPKLAWFKQNAPESWNRAAHFYDLADYLTARASGSDVRSLCTTACKWGYPGADDKWNDSWFAAAGLSELSGEGYARIGSEISEIGSRAGSLTAAAANDLGLVAGMSVGVGVIDAHCGAIGSIGGAHPAALENRLAMVAGTSSCHLIASAEAKFIPGIWGPYWGAMIPGLWLNEGGQSATGSVIDHVIDSHAQGGTLKAEAAAAGVSLYALLNDRLPADFRAASNLHVMPDFHGNRSPVAEPHMRGVISGLSLDSSAEQLVLLYLATLQGVALGTRAIVDQMEKHGAQIDVIILSGGQSKNPAFVRILCDALQRPVLMAQEPEAMLLGGAMIAATAAGRFGTLPEAMDAMNSFAVTLTPDAEIASYYAAKYAVFDRMTGEEQAHRAIMADFSNRMIK